MRSSKSRVAIWLAVTLSSAMSCGNTTREEGGMSGVRPEACLDVCGKLSAGGCLTKDQCAYACVEAWRKCASWAKAVACFDSNETYSCAAPQEPCAGERTALTECEQDILGLDAGIPLVPCTPGEELPPCACDGSVAAGGICPPSGQTYKCC